MSESDGGEDGNGVDRDDNFQGDEDENNGYSSQEGGRPNI